VHLIRATVRHDLDVAVEVRSKHRDLGSRGQRGEGFMGRMAVLVALTRRDDSRRRPDGVKEARRRGRRRAMVSDLEDIDDGEDVAVDQRRLDRGLGVPGQEGVEAAMAEHQDHRPVVDVAFREWCCGVDICRVQDLDRRRPVERDDLSGAGEDEVRARAHRRIGQEPMVSRILVRDAGMEDSSDLKALEHVDEAGDVILVGMTEHHQVDASCEEGQVRAETAQREPWVRAAVDQHRCAVRCLHEDGIALSDIQHRHVQATVGARGDRDGKEQRDEGAAHRFRPEEACHDGRPGSLFSPGHGVRDLSLRADRPRDEADDREPGDGDGRRHRHVNRGVGERGDSRSQHHDHPQDEPRGPTRQPGRGVADQRHVQKAIDQAGQRGDGAEEHGHRHARDDQHVRHWRDER
jgi:hypothetical protein